MSEKSRFRDPFDKEHSKRAEALLKSQWQHLYHIYWSLWRQFSWKKFFLVICKTLGLFLNTSTADDKYSFLNRNNLMQHLQVQLSQKRKNFTTFSFAFSKLIFNFEYFQNHDDPNSRCIFELPGSEKRI